MDNVIPDCIFLVLNEFGISHIMICTLLCYISPDVEIRSSVVGLLNTLLGAGVVESFYMSRAAPQADLLTREYSMRA